MFMEPNRTEILEDLCSIISRTANASEMLDRIVRLVASKLETDVCSVYVLNGEHDYLVLQATVGLNRESVGRIGMNLREGLTGLVLERLEPLFVLHPGRHARNKHFDDSGEEAYQTYLGIPLVYRRDVLGVLVIQTLREDGISESDIPVLSAVAGQISAVLAYTGLVEVLQESRQTSESAVDPGGVPNLPRPQRTPRKAMLQGVPVSTGFADGHAHYVGTTIGFDHVERRRVADPQEETVRLARALERTRKDFDALRSRVEGLSPQDEAILDAQIMYLEDVSFKDKVLVHISEGYSAEYSLKRVVMDTVDSFRSMNNHYLQERAVELEDLFREVLGNLLGLERSNSKVFSRDTILIASDLSPTELIGLNQERLKGIALARGGKTSHTSILARSFEIPMVIGLRDVLETVHEGDFLILDATSGLLFSRPIQEIADEYARLKEEKNREAEMLGELRDLPATTLDGQEVKLGANIGLLSDLAMVDKYGADHIGLYRTEFPFLARKDFPSEDVQTGLYGRILQGSRAQSTAIRTLDVGGDKFLSYLDYPRENNPYLGWRSIRVSLEMDGPFRTQIRAILRSSEHGRVKMLFPMITSVEEILRVREILEEEKRSLEEESVQFDPQIPIGIMVEVPGTVRILDRFLPYVDFVSIGTNDLIQYTLAVDRNNQKVADLYSPLHPSVIALVYDAVTTCRKQGKEVSICGESTTQARCAYLFLGMGVDSMSMNPGSVPLIKRMIRGARAGEARQALLHVLEMETTGEVTRFMEKALPTPRRFR